jgi:hypothetical protein
MPYVGYTGVANQANTSDGFALHTSAANVVGSTPGDDVGDTGVVDLYGGTPVAKYYILMESSGYVLQEDAFKIELESN